MRRVIFTLLGVLAIQFGFSQTTYYWVGGTTPAAGGWSVGANWNTALNGSGTARTTSMTNDILIFDGSNIGGSSPTTGPVSVSLTSQTIGALQITNNADVALSRNGSGGTTTLTLGDAAGGPNALVVYAGSTLRLKGLTGSILLVLNSNAGASNVPPATTSATAMIYGNIVLEEGNATQQNRFTSRLKNAFVFTTGSSCKAVAAYAYYPFGSTGSSTTPAYEGVTFESGSTYIYEGGLSPFGSNSTSFQTKFLAGSKFIFRATEVSNMFGNRKYGHVVVENNATVTSNGSLLGIDSLRVDAGATFITNTSGSTPINGHILVNGTFKVRDANPDRNNKVVMSGSSQQNISGTGTILLADFIISNQSLVVLQKDITVDSLTNIYGILNKGTFAINGPGTITTKAPSVKNITGNVFVDSLFIYNVSDFTGIESGMSVSLPGVIAPNTFVTNTSTTAGTITLSQFPIANSTGGAFMVFNGQGVLPISFGTISATLQANQTNVVWNILTEDGVVRYEVERSADGRSFSKIGTVAANRMSQYIFSDVAPLTGVNYYRIKAISVDGTEKYSGVVRISNSKGKGGLSIYPNPVEGNVLNISLTDLAKDNYTIVVTNAQGQKVYTQTVGVLNNTTTVSVQLPASVKPGVYNVLVAGSNETLNKQVLVK